jgi:NADPH2:quinone reductase
MSSFFRAMICDRYGPAESLRLGELGRQALGPCDARIEIAAAAVNFQDLLSIEGKYQVKVEPPFAPGMEAAGTVVEVGSDVTGIGPGTRVIAPLPHGAYAEEAVTPAASLIPIPPAMDFTIAAGFGGAYTTAYHALVQRGALAAGETLVVNAAAGGVGLAAVQIGRALDAHVIGAGGDDAKLATVLAEGAEHVINYRRDKLRDRIKELTRGRGADVIFDPVGGDVFDESLRSIAWGGRILVIGFTGGRIADAPTNLVLLKGCSVVGVFGGAFAMREPERQRGNLEQLFRWFEEGKVRPRVDRVLPLERAVEGMVALRERRVVGKVILSTGRGGG